MQYKRELKTVSGYVSAKETAIFLFLCMHF